jgi:hypothetical protein
VTFTGAPATDFVVAQNQVPDTSGTGTGYLSLTSTALYVGMDGLAPAATTYTVVYIGNGAATGGATASTPATGGVPLPIAAGIQYAVQFPTEGTGAAQLLAWNGTAWGAPAAGPTPVVNTLMTAEEFSILLSALPQLTATPSTITVLGSEVTGATVTTPAPVTAVTFPSGGAATLYGHWFAYPTGSCLYPSATVQ